MVDNSDLLRSLTTYDDRAKLNEQLIFQHKVQLYSKQIEFTEKYNKFRGHLLSLRPLNCSFLHSAFLNDNAMFKDIKNIYLKYNNEVTALMTENTEPEEYNIRPKVMECMLRFMQHVITSDNRDIQLKLLKCGYDWFMAKLDPKTKYNPDANYYQQLHIIVHQHIQPVQKQKPNMNLPSQQMKFETRHYRWKARTLYPDINTPSERLKDYNTRIINFESENNITAQPINDSASRVKYVKPPNMFFRRKDDIVEQPSMTEETKDTGRLGQTDGQKPPEEPIDQGNDQPQLGEEVDDAEVEEEPEEEDGKLNPNTKNYLFPKVVDHEGAMNRLTHWQSNKSNHQKRKMHEDKDVTEVVKQWARNRGKFKNQTFRRLESSREFSKMNKFQPIKKKILTQISEKFIDFTTPAKPVTELNFEDKANQQRVQLIKRRNQHHLKSYRQDYDFNTARGLSIYDRSRTKTQTSADSRRPFSQLLKSYSRQRQNRECLDEIAKIKEKFSKNKIGVELSKLEEGLSYPEDLGPEQIESAGKLQPKLPSNPYFKVAKKKKKKKKK